MLHIFIISNDVRVEKLIEFFQPFFKTKIRRASDFDQGLQEVFENRPSVVFIQSSIGSVSGETIARHIKSLLGSGSPRIVFMGEDGERAARKAAWWDNWICITDSEQKLRENFSRILNDYYPADWNEISREMEKPAPLQAGPGVGIDIFRIPEDVVTPAEPGDTQPSETAPAQVVPTKIAAEESEEAPPGKDLHPADTDLPFEIFPDDSTPYHGSPLIPEFPQRKKRTSILVLLGLPLLFLLSIAGGWFYFRSKPDIHPPTQTVTNPSTSPAPRHEPSPPPSAPANTARTAPSFIKKEWQDSAYSASHPGWERYLAPDYDIRLFRENAVINALQIIARENGLIPAAYLTSILGEFGLQRPHSVGSVERKDGLLVEKTMLAEKTELVVYKSEGDGQIRAFVLAFQ
jgi:flagellar FliL protein